MGGSMATETHRDVLTGGAVRRARAGRAIGQREPLLPEGPCGAVGCIGDLDAEPRQFVTYLISLRPVVPLTGACSLGYESLDRGTLLRGNVVGVSARPYLGWLNGCQPKAEQCIGCGDHNAPAVVGDLGVPERILQNGEGPGGVEVG